MRRLPACTKLAFVRCTFGTAGPRLRKPCIYSGVSPVATRKLCTTKVKPVPFPVFRISRSPVSCTDTPFASHEGQFRASWGRVRSPASIGGCPHRLVGHRAWGHVVPIIGNRHDRRYSMNIGNGSARLLSSLLRRVSRPMPPPGPRQGLSPARRIARRDRATRRVRWETDRGAACQRRESCRTRSSSSPRSGTRSFR
jgi:hypothetical protein